MDGYIANHITKRGTVICPIVLAAEVLTDQWSVIIIRDVAFFDQRTFGSIIKNNNEKIPRATLANRLKRLCDVGLLSTNSDKNHSQRKIYSLTERTIDLLPVIVGMASWATMYSGAQAEKVGIISALSSSHSSEMVSFMDRLRAQHGIG